MAHENGSQELLDELQQITECALCLETLLRPRTLPCQHVFCEQCLHKHITSSSISFENSSTTRKPKKAFFNCPNCRRKILVPKHKAKAFPNAFHHKNLIEAIHKCASVEDKSEDSEDASENITSTGGNMNMSDMTTILLIANDIAKWLRETDTVWSIRTTPLHHAFFEILFTDSCHITAGLQDIFLMNIQDYYFLCNCDGSTVTYLEIPQSKTEILKLESQYSSWYERLKSMSVKVFSQLSKLLRLQSVESTKDGGYKHCDQFTIPNQRTQSISLFQANGQLVQNYQIPAIQQYTTSGVIQDFCTDNDTVYIIYRNSPEVLSIKLNSPKGIPSADELLTQELDKYSAYTKPKCCIGAGGGRVAIGVLDTDHSANHSVLLLNATGISLFAYGRSQGHPLYPAAVAISPSHLVFIADYHHRNICVLSPEGTLIGNLDISFADMEYPCALAFNSDQRLLIASKSKPVTANTLTTLTLTTYKVHMLA